MPEPGLPDTQASREIMPGAVPVFIDQGELGILFFHGFTGSPYEGRDLATHFAKKGYGVWVPLLPGHGTHPEDLEGISHQQWFEVAEHWYREMCTRYKQVFVCGQSMGGALTLHIAANFPVNAFATLAAPVFVKDWRLPWLMMARWFVDYYHKSKGPDISDPDAKKRSAAYSRYPLDSLTEFLHLIAQVRNELSNITAPALLIHSRRDHTITYDNLRYIAEHIASQDKKLVTLEKSYHVISVDCEKETIFTAIESMIEQHY